ncbi:hydroxyacid dehydrogenase [Litorilinea aerophila]|uniref:Hydroxyacid dehydrogenase n=1 Tax=Litorilinea aerophila TaxID=1204385 RepID=A0A540VDE9_9CHLR|nr:hydroxyacid dehydrogenase [Litorilinea aerophila]MCC9077485.1 hydroxyacid dehydrogenase [Litorilinea aerophila]
MKPKVVMQFELRMGAADLVREVADVIIDPTMEQAAGADVVVVGGMYADAAFMDRVGPNLKAIAKPGIGVDNIDVDAATERNILVIHTPDAPTESTAEHAVALLMAVAKRVMVGDMHLRHDRSIGREEMMGTELLDRTLGVVGYGRIGRRVAEICALGLRMNVLVFDPFVDKNLPTPERVTLTDNLDELLRRAHFVTVHVPLTPATRHLIGERELRLMQPGSYLINASRGPVVDEAALIRALQDGHLAAAGLDVFDPEPPAPDNPLLSMRNVVVTPHIASNTDRGIRAMNYGVAEQVVQVLRGERPPFIVNAQVWPGRVPQTQSRSA